MKSFATVTLVVAVILVTSATALTSYTLERLFVVHRHGARTPLVWANESVLCGPSGCGQLTAEGKDMLFHLGRYINENYNNTGGARSGSQTVFRLPPEYNTKNVVTMSTNYPRTVQSAAGVLCGLFDCPSNPTTSAHSYSAPDFLPYIETIPKDREIMMRPDKGWPTLTLHNAANEDALWSMMNDVTLSIVNATELYRIGAEIGLGSECGVGAGGAPTEMDKMQPYVCALDAQDFWECTYSYPDGKEILAKKYPFLATKGDTLTKVLHESNYYQWYGFDRKHYPKYHSQIGRYGYYLVKDILRRASANMTNNPGAQGSDYGQGPDAEAARLIEYSGHDVTVMSLQDSLGNQSYLQPVFAKAMILEVHRQYGKQYIRAKMGQPGLTADDHSYTFDWFQIHCVDASNKEYTATSEGCLLEDFERFVSAKGTPANPLGVCAALPEDLAAENCLANSTGKPSHSCTAFRNGCPDTSCGEGYFLKKNTVTGDLSCVVIGSATPKKKKDDEVCMDAKKHRYILAGVAAVGILLLLIILVLVVKVRSLSARLVAKHELDEPLQLQ